MEKPTDSVAIVSGGLDSTTLVYEMLHKGYTPHLLSFNYGQRHVKELSYAKATAKKLDLPHDVIDLRGMTHLISNSALTSPKSTPGNPGHKYDAHGHKIGDYKDIEVPEGHYAEENMRLTVVPNRNMIMLAIAAGVAVNEHARRIGIGVHAGDHVVYPDCRPNFIAQLELTLMLATEGFNSFPYGPGRQIDKPEGFAPSALRAAGEVYMFGKPIHVEYIAEMEGPIFAPFLNKSKADIALRALELGVPLHETWSCYKGGDKHCGRCGTCVERLEAIDEAVKAYNLEKNKDNYPSMLNTEYDMTPYEDDEYWKTQVNK